MKQTIEKVLQAHTKTLMAIPGIVGIGEGLLDGRACITIYIDKNSYLSTTKMPRSIEGYPVKLTETSTVRAFPNDG